MNPKLVKQAVAFAAEFSEQDNERIVVVIYRANAVFKPLQMVATYHPSTKY